MRRLILASASPRRRDLLALAGVDFEAIPSGVEELVDGDPAELVVENARRKAEAVAASIGERVDDRTPILGVDTDVVLDGALLGKPSTEAEARERLEALSGCVHAVLSGVALTDGSAIHSELVRTDVGFRVLDRRDIDAYVGSGEWRDRAGGYAVQGLGSSLIESIDGDLSNVIGLPVSTVLRMIEELHGR